MIEVCALASGSNGNCYYIGNNEDAILIDAGISARQIILRLKEKKLHPEKIKGIFITHEHSDHTRGARVLCNKLHIPVFLTKKTYQSIYHKIRPNLIKYFEPNNPFQFESFLIHPISKLHDATDPVSFRIEYNQKNIGVFTDIGHLSNNIISQIQICHVLFLETNYDEEMLNNGRYPAFLKKRIASEIGHLSNKQAFDLLNSIPLTELECIFLSHLSRDNNTPEIAFSTIKSLNGNYEIKLAGRYSPSEIYVLQN